MNQSQTTSSKRPRSFDSIRFGIVMEEIETIRMQVTENAMRVAALGNWPDHVRIDGLAERVPTGNGDAPGFDAGLAVALDMIPRHKQRLAATLHAGYTAGAIAQVRAEAANLSPDSETCWWLAACSVCKEGGIDAEEFLDQITLMTALAQDPAWRLDAAKAELKKMLDAFWLEVREGTQGFPFGKTDGSIQGAYLDGHKFGSMYSEAYGLWFIGTYCPSLGLDTGFTWSDEKDEKGRAKSGPVHGSRQFVKCATEDEFLRAVAVVQQHLL